MLQLEIKPTTVYSEESNTFITLAGGDLLLEHSLLAISKWEEKTHKPFFNQTEMTAEDLVLYVKCMTTNTPDPLVYLALTNDDINTITSYMQDSHTATWFSNKDPKPKTRSSEALTSELIYYYMSQVPLPIEMETWNINRLFALLRIAAVKSQPSKKMDRASLAKQNAALNRSRLKGRRH